MKRLKNQRIILIITAVILLLAVLLITSAVINPSGEVVVVIPKAVSHMPYSSNFWPSYIRVVIGVNNTVKWVNLDDHMHTATALDWSFHSGELNLYDTFTFIFTQKGTYRYRCLPHPWMEGIVEVA